MDESDVRAGGDIVGGDENVGGDKVSGGTVHVQRGLSGIEVLGLILIFGLIVIILVAIFMFGNSARTPNSGQLPTDIKIGSGTVIPPTVSDTGSTPKGTLSTCVPAMQFGADVTLAGENPVNPDALVDKVWGVENKGNCAWGGEGYELVQTNGETLELVDYEIPRTEGAKGQRFSCVFAHPSKGARIGASGDCERQKEFYLAIRCT